MAINISRLSSIPVHVLALLAIAVAVGCGRTTDPAETVEADPSATAAAVGVPAPADDDQEAVPTESVDSATAEQLLSARLPTAEATEGWIRLFDGHTLFGWEPQDKANFRVVDGSIVVDNGEPCLLCTSLPWRDYELIVEFKAGPATNSGVFLRTPVTPTDPASDCYEVNIAPDDNPFPTAGIVKRLRATPKSEQHFDQWRTMRMRLEGGNLQVSLDGELVCDYTDPEPLPRGRIGLQHNSGPVAFREVKLRPLGLSSLLDAELNQWTRYPEMPGTFSVTDQGWLHVQGGRTQLETKQTYDDFVLLAEYKLPTAEMNSGIFFRCIPGDEMMGYECQLSNEMKDDYPLTPADHGTGGIFRRQEARVVAGQVNQWTPVLLVAAGPRMGAWVAGVQVTNWTDEREPDENPRRGLRTDPGTIMIQGHDPKTDALLKQIRVGSLR